MKPTSKKDEYIVKCENSNETTTVKNTLCNTNMHSWHYYKYVIKTDYLFPGSMLWNEMPNGLNFLPVISFEEWQPLPDEEFILPEKWCVQHYPETLNWIRINAKYNGNKIPKSLYYNYPEDSSGSNWSRFKSSEFTEITFEQFKEHVLGKNNISEKVQEKFHESEFNNSMAYGYEPKGSTESKEIIGYKLVKEEYKQAVKSIIKNDKWFDNNWDLNLKERMYNFASGEHSKDVIFSLYNTLKNAGILDLWFEPVYKPETITLKSGVELSESDIEEVRELIKMRGICKLLSNEN